MVNFSQRKQTVVLYTVQQNIYIYMWQKYICNRASAELLLETSEANSRRRRPEQSRKKSSALSLECGIMARGLKFRHRICVYIYILYVHSTLDIDFIFEKCPTVFFSFSSYHSSSPLNWGVAAAINRGVVALFKSNDTKNALFIFQRALNFPNRCWEKIYKAARLGRTADFQLDASNFLNCFHYFFYSKNEENSFWVDGI